MHFFAQATGSSVTPAKGSRAASGQSSGEIDEVYLSVDTSGLSRGLYTCQLTIFDPDISGCIRYVPVKLFIGSKLLVPSQYPNIQSAIDAADDYDIVLVADGNYTGEGNTNLSPGWWSYR